MSEVRKTEAIAVDLSCPGERDPLPDEGRAVASWDHPAGRDFALHDGEGGRACSKGTRGALIGALRPSSASLCFVGFLVGCTMMILAPFTAHAEEKAAIRYSAHLYAQGIEPQQVESPSFTCDDEIHLRVTWKGLPVGKRQLEIVWLDSRGKVWANSRGSFIVKHPGQILVSDYWFVFTSSAFEQFSGWELGASQKAGKWRVQALLDGTPVLEKEYRVAC